MHLKIKRDKWKLRTSYLFHSIIFTHINLLTAKHWLQIICRSYTWRRQKHCNACGDNACGDGTYGNGTCGDDTYGNSIYRDGVCGDGVCGCDICRDGVDFDDSEGDENEDKINKKGREVFPVIEILFTIFFDV